jgi:hypothetical protein
MESKHTQQPNSNLTLKDVSALRRALGIRPIQIMHIWCFRLWKVHFNFPLSARSFVCVCVWVWVRLSRWMDGWMDGCVCALCVLWCAASLMDATNRPDFVSRSTDRTLCIVLQIAEGLCWLHACGLVHGDLKPANIMRHTQADGTTLLCFLVLLFYCKSCSFLAHCSSLCLGW